MLQGVGAALLTPGQPGDDPGRLRAARTGRRRSARGPGWAASPAAIGPFVGGALVEYADWRWIFLINLPIAVAHRVHRACGAVPETRDPHALGALRRRRRGAGRRWPSAGATYALIEWGGHRAPWARSWWRSLAAVGFVVVERASDQPMLPLGIFAQPDLQRRQRDDAAGVRRARARCCSS